MRQAGWKTAKWKAWAVAGAFTLATPLLMGAAMPPNNFSANNFPDFKMRVLNEQNRERVAMGLQPLAWDDNLASSAQGWADHMAATGRFEHAPENQQAPQGENLWAGTRGYYKPEAMVDAWVREKRFFRAGLFPDNSTTGRVEDIGHYTQIVWRSTHAVGCARAASAAEDILVCRYSEAGNWRGERPF